MNESKFSPLDGGDRGFVWYQLCVSTLYCHFFSD
jgi:hypothetical protein